eukprot:snap_masked-scaffold_9-processed-gene-5.42-mRNA-1 protein AED:1.00 eAED:1.00 QI:0/0/0/0/1/1/2/0/188
MNEILLRKILDPEAVITQDELRDAFQPPLINEIVSCITKSELCNTNLSLNDLINSNIQPFKTRESSQKESTEQLSYYALCFLTNTPGYLKASITPNDKLYLKSLGKEKMDQDLKPLKMDLNWASQQQGFRFEPEMYKILSSNNGINVHFVLHFLKALDENNQKKINQLHLSTVLNHWFMRDPKLPKYK